MSTNKPISMVLIDEGQIPSSFDGKTLLVNGVGVASICEGNYFDIDEIAGDLSRALNTTCYLWKVSEEQLARTCAQKHGIISELEAKIASGEEVEFDYYCQGYSNDDLHRAWLEYGGMAS